MSEEAALSMDIFTMARVAKAQGRQRLQEALCGRIPPWLPRTSPPATASSDGGARGTGELAASAAAQELQAQAAAGLWRPGEGA
jgi:hypothetical protein